MSSIKILEKTYISPSITRGLFNHKFISREVKPNPGINYTIFYSSHTEAIKVIAIKKPYDYDNAYGRESMRFKE